MQTAVYARLASDASVTSLVTGVFDAVPENQAVPYIALGEATEVPDRTFGNNGHELTMTLHIYDQDGVPFKGRAVRGFLRSLAILEALVTSLESADYAVAGHNLVLCECEFRQPIREPDDAGGMYRHIPARFRVVLEDA